MADRRLLAILGVARLTAASYMKQPAWFVQYIFILIAYFILLWAWGGERGVSYMITGSIISAIFMTGINLVGQEVGWGRVMRVLDLFIASPVTPRMYMAGVVLGSLPWELASLPVFVLIGAATGQLKLVLVSYAVAIALTPLAVLIGLSIGFYVKKPMNISAITNAIGTSMVLLPPVYYPASVLPEPLRYVAMLAPTAAGAELARLLGGIEQAFSLEFLLAILAIWTLAALLATSRVVKWSLD